MPSKVQDISSQISGVNTASGDLDWVAGCKPHRGGAGVGCSIARNNPDFANHVIVPLYEQHDWVATTSSLSTKHVGTVQCWCEHSCQVKTINGMGCLS